MQTALLFPSSSPAEEDLDYIRIAKFAEKRGPSDKSLESRVTGKFFTPVEIGHSLAATLASLLQPPNDSGPIRVVDPFCGDGRLIEWFLLSVAEHRTDLRSHDWQIALWDCNPTSLAAAERTIRDTTRRLSMSPRLEFWLGDSLSRKIPASTEKFDIVITNPPWETVKPDRRELSTMQSHLRDDYVDALGRLARRLTDFYPAARPKRCFSGWGVNLARVGVEAALRLLCPNGLAGLVSPASLLADQNSECLRRWILTSFACPQINFFPAEARLFSGVDQPAISMVLRRAPVSTSTRINSFGRDRKLKSSTKYALSRKYLEENNFVLPISFGVDAIEQLREFNGFPRFRELEGPGDGQLWAGREIDETNHQEHLAKDGTHLFLKGRMIDRFSMREMPSLYLDPKSPKHVIPPSVHFPRIVWRDVSRPNQKRRIQATLIPPIWITGNSLGVAHFRTRETTMLLALLGVVSSLCFEFQVRAQLSTAHISLGVLRRARIPDMNDKILTKRLARLVTSRINGDLKAEFQMESLVAEAFGLKQDSFESIVHSFDKLTPEEKASIVHFGRKR